MRSGDFLLLVVCLFVNCTAWGKVKPMWVVWIEGSHISLTRFKIYAEKTGVIGPVLSLFCTVLVWWFMSCSFPGKHTYLFDLLPGLLQLLWSWFHVIQCLWANAILDYPATGPPYGHLAYSFWLAL